MKSFSFFVFFLFSFFKI
ncbi:hypothetical protein RDI58_020755 [Solanum bulbocastanum]|uniref:Uncharacterized protein n=1 Tax=Solanum bulbocastanum TaxID=147425 RepID=A0AAN8TAI5_SOLBU